MGDSSAALDDLERRTQGRWPSEQRAANRIRREFRSRPTRTWPTLILGALFAINLYIPYLVEPHFSSRFLSLLLLLCWGVVYVLVSRQLGAFAIGLAGAGAYVLVLVGANFLDYEIEALGYANAQRYLLVMPFGIAVGVQAYRLAQERVFARAYIAVSLAMVIPAFVEYARSQSLLGRDFAYFVEYGRPRALVASDHPLVLGLLFLVALALTTETRTWLGRAVALALGLGIWTTGSEGPMLLAIPILVLVFTPRLRKWLGRSWKSVGIAILGVLVIGWYLTVSVWTGTALGATSGEYSRAYRAAMYSLLPSILQEHLFGYGLNGLPMGVWYIDSEYKGVRDIAITLDSEPMFLATLFGIVGLAVYVAVYFLAARAIRGQFAFSVALLCVCTVGLVLAITVWNSLSGLAAVLIGVCLVAGEAAPAPTAVHRERGSSLASATASRYRRR